MVLEQRTINCIDSYKYLWTSKTEIKNRIRYEKHATKHLNEIVWNSQILPENIITYGAEVWEITKQFQNTSLSMEMTTDWLTIQDRICNNEIEFRYWSWNLWDVRVPYVECRKTYGHTNNDRFYQRKGKEDALEKYGEMVSEVQWPKEINKKKTEDTKSAGHWDVWNYFQLYINRKYLKRLLKYILGLLRNQTI